MLINIDYDGVVVDSLGRLVRLACIAHDQLGLGRPATEADFQTLETLSFPHLARKLEVPADDVERFADKMFALQAEDHTLPPVFGEMPGILKRLSNAHRLVVVTSSLSQEVEAVLKLHSFDDSISLILDGQDRRPKSAKIKLAMERFGFASRETYMIGDARSDVREGKLAGVKTVAVTWGFHKRDFLGLERPDFLVDSPGELASLFA